MAAQLKPDEPLGKGVRRIARHQIDKALDALTGLTGSPPDEVVHAARKRFKKVRALLRLARAGLDRDLVRREDARFRDAGRPLSEVRDAGVLVDAFDALIERLGAPGHPEAVPAVHEALVRRRDEIGRRVLHEAQALAGVTAAVRKARRGVKRWEVKGGDGRVVRRGLRRVYTAGHDALRAAAPDARPDDESLHELRKRVKDLWYVLDVLHPLRPGVLGPRADQAHALADALGDDHDLAVLRGLVADGDGDADADRRVVDPGAAAVVVPLIDARRAELQRDAFALARAVYAEPPAEFVARLSAYWRAWRSEAEAARFESRSLPPVVSPFGDPTA